jgi:hypothetical protein
MEIINVMINHTGPIPNHKSGAHLQESKNQIKENNKKTIIKENNKGHNKKH